MIRLPNGFLGKAVTLFLLASFSLTAIRPNDAVAQSGAQVLESNTRIEPKQFRPYLEETRIHFALREAATVRLELMEEATGNVVYSPAHHLGIFRG